MKVKVDRDLCVGIGNCVAVAPTVFHLDSSRKAVAREPSSIDEAKLMKAAESCPVNAIILEDDSGQQIYP
jgi:ferredoxin